MPSARAPRFRLLPAITPLPREPVRRQQRHHFQSFAVLFSSLSRHFVFASIFAFFTS